MCVCVCVFYIVPAMHVHVISGLNGIQLEAWRLSCVQISSERRVALIKLLCTLGTHINTFHLTCTSVPYRMSIMNIALVKTALESSEVKQIFIL